MFYRIENNNLKDYADYKYSEDCNFDEEVDKDNIPNAVCLSNGKVACFNDRDRIDMVYFNTTLSIS